MFLRQTLVDLFGTSGLGPVLEQLAGVAVARENESDDWGADLFRICDFALGNQAYRLLGSFEDSDRFHVMKIQRSAASEAPGVPLYASHAEIQAVALELREDSSDQEDHDVPYERKTEFTTPRTELELALCASISAAIWRKKDG